MPGTGAAFSSDAPVDWMFESLQESSETDLACHSVSDWVFQKR
jgi:hypothetical protein